MVIHLLIYFYTNEKLNKNVKQNDDEEWKTGGWWEGMSTESKRCTHATIYIFIIYICMYDEFQVSNQCAGARPIGNR